jgi:hypothetical protein
MHAGVWRKVQESPGTGHSQIFWSTSPANFPINPSIGALERKQTLLVISGERWAPRLPSSPIQIFLYAKNKRFPRVRHEPTDVPSVIVKPVRAAKGLCSADAQRQACEILDKYQVVRSLGSNCHSSGVATPLKGARVGSLRGRPRGSSSSGE